jgi:hypothetical protein
MMFILCEKIGCYMPDDGSRLPMLQPPPRDDPKPWRPSTRCRFDPFDPFHSNTSNDFPSFYFAPFLGYVLVPPRNEREKGRKKGRAPTSWLGYLFT